jgi:SAM-dependent methyltransferase
MAKFVVEFGKTVPPMPDGRLQAPAFARNHEAIWQALAPYLRDANGDVLEAGSGTGQHVSAFAARAPQLTWWPSDIYPSHLASIEAWRRHAGLENVRAPQRIDLTDGDWTWSRDGQAGGALAAVICINVLHIAPWRVSQNLIAGAARALRDGGHLFVYGPFKRAGAHTAPSNEDFDASLRTENPDWGVRDVDDLAALGQATGLPLTDSVPMPANNLVLVFTRARRQD